jgi:hypothetical protein
MDNAFSASVSKMYFYSRREWVGRGDRNVIMFSRCIGGRGRLVETYMLMGYSTVLWVDKAREFILFLCHHVFHSKCPC